MDVDLLYVVNIVRQRGPIACHRLACLGALSHSLTHTHTHTHTQTNHTYILCKMRQRLVYAEGWKVNYSLVILLKRSIPI